LNDNGGFEICVICWWEDDGQTDTDADEVRGGPNSHYSLTLAKKNFADHGHMYGKDDAIQVVVQPSSARRALMNYLDSIHFDPVRADPTRLGELLSAEDRHVRSVGR
jgi:Cysteine-rich CPCC